MLSGWWLGHPSEKYEFVNWDDDSNPIYGKLKLMFQTTNQICYEKGNSWLLGYPYELDTSRLRDDVWLCS